MKKGRHKANKYEGEDILNLFELASSDQIIDDELTRGRIRAIYVRVKYGKESTQSIANYYDVSEELIRNIVDGKFSLI
jgi:hypothetical protein